MWSWTAAALALGALALAACGGSTTDAEPTPRTTGDATPTTTAPEPDAAFDPSDDDLAALVYWEPNGFWSGYPAALG